MESISQQAGELLLGQASDEILLGGNVGAEVVALGGVKPRWVVRAWNGRDEGVDDRGQSFALDSVEFEAHDGDLSWSVGRRDAAAPYGSCIDLVSRNSSSPHSPNSRPLPDCW